MHPCIYIHINEYVGLYVCRCKCDCGESEIRKRSHICVRPYGSLNFLKLKVFVTTAILMKLDF